MTPSGSPDFALPSQVLVRDVDGELVLLNLETEQYFGLDAVGAAIVKKLVAVPREEAVTALLRDYEVDAASLERDVDSLTGQLLAAGLIVSRAPARE